MHWTLQLIISWFCRILIYWQVNWSNRRGSKQMTLAPAVIYLVQEFYLRWDELSSLNWVLAARTWELNDPKDWSLVTTLTPQKGVDSIWLALESDFYEGSMLWRFYCFPLKIQTALWLSSLICNTWGWPVSSAHNFSSASKQAVNTA